MAIDPSISLGVRVPQFNFQMPSPIEQQGRLMTLRGLMDQQQLRQLQIDQARQEMATAQQEREAAERFRSLYTDPNNPPSATDVYRTLGTKGAAVVKTQADIDKQNLDNAITRANRFAQVANTVTDAPSRNRAVMQLMSEGVLSPQQARDITAQPFDLAATQQFARTAMTTAEQLNQKRNDAEEARKAALHPSQLAEAKAKASGAELEYAAMTAPNNQAGWDVWYPKLTPALQAQISPQFSPAEADRVRRLALKPNEFFTGQRAEQTAAETARHNRRVEELTGQGHAATAANQLATRESQLRQDFIQVFKPYQQVADMYGALNSVRQTDDPFKDLIYTFSI